MRDPLCLWNFRDVQRSLGERIRLLRLGQGFKQSTLAQRSGVSLASLRRLERTGQTSLMHLLKLSQALGKLDDFDAILQPPPATTIDELLADKTRPARHRGTR